LADVPGISFEELLRYEEEQSRQWRELFSKKPFLLKLEATATSTVADLLFHTFTSEYRIAQRLLGEQMTHDKDFSRQNVGDLFSIGDAARIRFREYLAHATEEEMSRTREYPSLTLGEFTASPRKMLAHAVIHSVRHWAQVARVLRENGQRADFSHDLIFSKVVE
jgi:uncharacterized damage-inducible protein DinB